MALASIATRIFGSANDRRIKRYQPKVDAINALEAELEQLSDDDLKARTEQFREEFRNGRSLDDLMVPAFATVREASKRALGLRHFDVQLIGGMVLHEGSIAEMRTGEGKTLVATLPVYLNAIADKGVHVVTVNDYLARRDADWMGKVYGALGLSVGVIVHGLDDGQRREAYGSDVTYGTNNEFGFDYLRDNMKYSREQMAQRGHNFAIVDEVDSILVDEARTPLIISGPSEDRSDLYQKIDTYIPRLEEDDYEIDEKQRAVTFSDSGIEKLEAWLTEDELMKGESLYDVENVTVVHHLNSAIRAHKLFTRDKDYIVRNDEVVIIDEFTGRMMPGRRYSEGLHQAIEARERVPIQPENQTLASITFQNYFRLYEKLAGMTGTAATEAAEFADIYKLDVVTVPTNKPIKRVDEEDEVYRTVEEKFTAIVNEVKDARERGQPVLVGTTSIEKSEHLAEMLRKEGVKDLKVLNARYHEQEAHIVADAGVSGAVTIATNMAGRGTDIQLGGNLDMRTERECGDLEGEAREKKIAEIKQEIAADREKVLAAGGLYIIGTERHESRRIDNQLRGRGGRQGDPGRSKFFVSLQDDLMRIFTPEGMAGTLSKLGLEEGEAISHPWVSKALERSQAKVEARNFDIRKNILKFDDVMNDQRKVIFEQRLELMDDDNVTETVKGMREDVVADLVSLTVPPKTYPEQWDVENLKKASLETLGIDIAPERWVEEEGIDEEIVLERVQAASDALMHAREREFADALQGAGVPDPDDFFRKVEKDVLLQSLDQMWRDHLITLDHLSKVVGWRGVAQRDPLNEYKQEAYQLFEQLLAGLRETVVQRLSHIRPRIEMPAPPPMPEMNELHIDPQTGENDARPARGSAAAALAGAASGRGAATAEIDPNDPSTWGKVRRNEPCPCGSGKKYKHCHGAY